MDLSTAVSAMSAGVPQSGGGVGAVACPVCTLYLREGISLQRHLDTHPKEQVIEALIRASSSGVSALLNQACAPQTASQPQTPVPAPTPTPALPPIPATPQQQPQAASPSSHVPHTQSPYPIGPIFECPPINAMIPPPQFASFSYQQFVNNGTMMIPAQYAMAQAQAAPTSQMMQMLYSPYGMYHQQQIPTVQMISTPPMMPTSTATLPTTLPAIAPRIRPATNTSNITTVNETTASPPRPVSCAQQLTSPLPALSSVQQQQQPEPEPEPEAEPEPEPEPDPETETQLQQQNLVIESVKAQNVQKTTPEPDSILPDLEMPPSPDPPIAEMEDEQSVIHAGQQAQNSCLLEEQQHAQQYQRGDSQTLIITNTDDDKTERILPDIEDNNEIESLIVRQIDVVESHKVTEIQVEQCIERMETSVDETIGENDEENIPSDKEEISENLKDKTNNDVEVIQERIQPHDLSMSTDKSRTSNIENPETKQLSRLIVNMETEFSNVELSNKENEEILESSQEVDENMLSVEPVIEKHADEDEATNASYNKTTPEPIECKIIVAHEDTDVSSVSSTDSLQCDMEIQKINTSSYNYKYSQSCPTSPVSKKKFWRSLSRVSLRSEFCRSNENICSYPVGFEATSLQDYLKDNYNDEDMELEQSSGMIEERARSHTPLSTSMSGVSVLKSRCSKLASSPLSVSSSTYCHMEEEEEDSEAESCGSCHSNEKDEEEEDEDEDQILMDNSAHKMIEIHERNEKKQVLRIEDGKGLVAAEISQDQQDQPADFRTQCLVADHYSTNQFPLDHHTVSQQQTSAASIQHETYPLSNSEISQNLLNMSECADPTTSADSKSYCSSNKSIMQKPSTELLNISEDAHAGPMNVFEFDGLQILVPSTFISESSQKAVSGTSQQSMSSSENGAGNDEEVKSVNMRADETMPPRGELSEQESNGCTEQSAWQLYMGQESSRMSTSYDLMARESWEESEGSDHEENNAGPLLDSRSLATHFTSSLFLDRDRKTPTRRVFKCSHCPEVFECPKERRVHSTMVHKEAGPSSCSNDNMDNQPDLRDLKLLDGRANVFDDLFVPSSLHVQQTYLQHHQQPLLHQLQPPQHSSSAKSDTDAKIDSLHLSTVTEVTCTICNQRFSSEKSLQIHHRRMHMTEPSKRVREHTKCPVCGEAFSSIILFNAHLKIHPLECGQCGKYFYRKQNFKLHMKRHLGIKPFPCTVCEKAFLTKQKLDEHTNGHTGNAPVKCNLCNETFRRYSNLTQHKNRHHLNIKKKLKDYICHCGEVFHTKKKLAWHKETHDEKPKACTYCNERFIHMASLTRHMRRAHNRRFVPDAQRENENVECPICKCIYLRSSLAVHMRVHNGERPYECQVCSKAFSTKWNLQLHKWTHAARSTKPFKCNQCSAAFYRHSDYTAHMNSHRNVRPYTCNYCGAQFIRKYNCLRHVKEHEENKAYTCDICSKTFHRSYYLKEHLRVHSGARPYTCHICGKSSSTKSNHNKHVRIHHAREPVNTEN